MAWRKWIYVAPLRLRSLFLRRRVEQDLDDELSFHLAMEASNQAARGVNPSEARALARRRFGGLAQVREACLDALRLGWLDTLLRDVRYALRSFRRAPAFTLVALGSLAVGVGANCAAFSWADALLLRPLPVPRPSEVLTVGSVTGLDAAAFTEMLRASYPEYSAIQQRSNTLDLAAFTTFSSGLAGSRDAQPAIKLGALVSGNFFSVLGIAPALGRAFRRDEDVVRDRDAVIVLSRRLWMQLGGDVSVLGRQIYLAGAPFTVIGVAPDGFYGVDQFVQVDFFVPIAMWLRVMPRPPGQPNPFEASDMRYLTVKGRLKPAVAFRDAEAELTLLARGLERDHPDTNRNRVLVARTELQARMAMMPPIAMLIALLTTLAVAVLFVACANVAGLLTSRAPARAREMAIRSAIGAGRGGLVRQLMTESLLIASGGGVLGLAIGLVSVKLFQQLRLPTEMPIGFEFSLDGRALTFGLAIAAASALLFGLAPAVQISRVDLTTVMKAGEAVTAARRRWGRNLLVVGQVAISVVLLVVALFTYRGFRQELSQGPGYRLERMLMMTFDPSVLRYSENDTRRFYERLLDRTRALPGVEMATLTSAVPMQTIRLGGSNVIPEGFALPPGQAHVSLMSAWVGEQYFSLMRIPIVRGREFSREDVDGAPHVAILNELAAGRYWPGQDPIGKRLQLVQDGGRTRLVAIVGVAKTSKYLLLAEPPTEYLYLPYRQESVPSMILLTATLGVPTRLLPSIRSVVRGLDANQPMFDVYTMEEFWQVSTIGLMNMIIGLIAAMGAMGLALSIVGLYGLVAYAASRRTKEIGVRMALGANRGHVLRMVMRHGLALAATGLLLGLLASVATGELLKKAFPGGDDSRDFMSLLLVTPAVLVVTALAAYLPARRAARVDPMEALRYE